MLLAFSACAGKSSTTIPPPPLTEEPVSNSGGTTSNDPYACSSDGDCVVSCQPRGECCEELCTPCANPYHRDEIPALQEWIARTCDTHRCPVARCVAPSQQGVARCTAGKCTAELIPITAP